jgi:hypothetical protein
MERLNKEELIRCLLFNYPQPTLVSEYQLHALRLLEGMQKRGDIVELAMSSAYSGALQFIPTEQGLRNWGVK